MKKLFVLSFLVCFMSSLIAAPIVKVSTDKQKTELNSKEFKNQADFKVLNNSKPSELLSFNSNVFAKDVYFIPKVDTNLFVQKSVGFNWKNYHNSIYSNYDNHRFK